MGQEYKEQPDDHGAAGRRHLGLPSNNDYLGCTDKLESATTVCWASTVDEQDELVKAALDEVWEAMRRYFLVRAILEDMLGIVISPIPKLLFH
ncbi:hypothetical protein BAE44_0017149 [Dichanthelium oligosanthes]|uniref:Uncharacterized protein n=1 Tax=Dichanthelium oligosanthes TaxID=888268 RepID=A0A1E5V9K8_9POAL|nr:hypothetical protein BAE44_0017149 [Dichanthelium oligosanthes]